MIEGIVLSPRNSTKAAALQAKFPELITVASSNQAVVDTSDVVVLALRPQVRSALSQQPPTHTHTHRRPPTW